MYPSNTIFVFGSNLAGRHGRGAAQFAVKWRGARYGVAEGLSGYSYAIPTKDANLNSLPLDAIAASVVKFLAFAAKAPGTTFEVTAIGCGLAGFEHAQIAPLFAKASDNCVLPYLWQRILNPALPIRVIVAGGREFNDAPLMRSKLDTYIGGRTDVRTVSGGARGADKLGERYAESKGLPRPLIVPADWDTFGRKAAGPIRNQRMSWLSSHLVAFWDGDSPGTKNMIETALRDGLETRVVRYSQAPTTLRPARLGP